MSDFIGDRECVTHHHACDCREEMFRKLQAERDKAVDALKLIEKDGNVNFRSHIFAREILIKLGEYDVQQKK